MKDSLEWWHTGLKDFGLLAVPILYIIYIIWSISTDFVTSPGYHLLMIYDVSILIMLIIILIGLVFFAFRLLIYKIGICSTSIHIKYLTKEQIINWNQIEDITTKRFVSIPSYSLILKSGEKVSLGTINKRLIERIEAHADKMRKTQYSREHTKNNRYDR